MAVSQSKKTGKKKAVFFIVAIIIAALAYLAFAGVKIGKFELKGANNMRYGIDIRGGVEALYVPKDGYKPEGGELEAARQIMETRLDSANITDRQITTDSESGTILVRFPWKSNETEFNAQEAITELGETAVLTFREAVEDENGNTYTSEEWIPTWNTLVEGKNVKSATAEKYQSQQISDTNNGSYQISLEFDEEGAKAFGDATAKLIGKPLFIMMDDMIISYPSVNQAITGGKASITGKFTFAEAKQLADRIKAGSLPFAMESSNNSTISPTLGQNALNIMVKSAGLAFILVCLFMLFYYRLPGFVAILALTLQVVGQLLSLSIPQFTLTLPGIAAIILSIGMGVDANVITSERIKEEIRAGKSIKSAISAGFHKAFSSVFDGNITVAIVAVLLMIFGSGSVLSFGYSLLTGVILNFVAGITATRLMTTSLSEFKGLQNPWLFGVKKEVTVND